MLVSGLGIDAGSAGWPMRMEMMAAMLSLEAMLLLGPADAGAAPAPGAPDGYESLVKRFADWRADPPGPAPLQHLGQPRRGLRHRDGGAGHWGRPFRRQPAQPRARLHHGGPARRPRDRRVARAEQRMEPGAGGALRLREDAARVVPPRRRPRLVRAAPLYAAAGLRHQLSHGQGARREPAGGARERAGRRLHHAGL